MHRISKLAAVFTAAICAAFLSLAWSGDAAAEQDLRALCAQVYNSTIYNAYINSKGQVVCTLSDMEWGSAARSKAKWDAQRGGRKKPSKSSAKSSRGSCRGGDATGLAAIQC